MRAIENELGAYELGYKKGFEEGSRPRNCRDQVAHVFPLFEKGVIIVAEEFPEKVIGVLADSVKDFGPKELKMGPHYYDGSLIADKEKNEFSFQNEYSMSYRVKIREATPEEVYFFINELANSAH